MPKALTTALFDANMPEDFSAGLELFLPDFSSVPEKTLPLSFVKNSFDSGDGSDIDANSQNHASTVSLRTASVTLHT